MLVIFGYLVVIATVFGGFVLSGGNLLALFQPLELLIIGGAGVGAFIVGNNMKSLKATGKAIVKLFVGKRYNKTVYMDLMALMFLLLSKSRVQGLISLEKDIEDPAGSEIFSAYPRLMSDPMLSNFNQSSRITGWRARSGKTYSRVGWFCRRSRLCGHSASFR